MSCVDPDSKASSAMMSPTTLQNLNVRDVEALQPEHALPIPPIPATITSSMTDEDHDGAR